MSWIFLIGLAFVSFSHESVAHPLVTPEQMALAQEILTPEQLAAALKAQELAHSVGRIVTGIEMEVIPTIVATKILPFLDLSRLDIEEFREVYVRKGFGAAIVDDYMEAGSSLSALPKWVQQSLTMGLEEQLKVASSPAEARVLIKKVISAKWDSLEVNTKSGAISFAGLAPILKAKTLALGLKQKHAHRVGWALPVELSFLAKYEMVGDVGMLELRHRVPTQDLFQLILDTRQLALHLGAEALLDHPELTIQAPITLHQHISVLDMLPTAELASLINRHLALQIFASQAPEPFSPHPNSHRSTVVTQFRPTIKNKGVIRYAPGRDRRRTEFRRLALSFEQQQVWIFTVYSDFKRDPEGTMQRLASEIRSMIDEKAARAIFKTIPIFENPFVEIDPVILEMATSPSDCALFLKSK